MEGALREFIPPDELMSWQMKLSGSSSVSSMPQAMLPGPLLQVGEGALVHHHVKPFP